MRCVGQAPNCLATLFFGTIGGLSSVPRARISAARGYRLVISTVCRAHRLSVIILKDQLTKLGRGLAPASHFSRSLSSGLRQEVALRLLFLFHRDRNGSNRRQANLVSLYASDKAAINEMVMALVAPFAAVLPGQLNAIAFDLINRTDVDTIRADNFHMLLDIGHQKLLPGVRA
jgi:hypothetical protein